MKLYFKLCLWMPLWLPALLLFLGYTVALIDSNAADALPDWFSMTLLVIAASVFFGGLQYCLALYIVWTRIDFESPRSWIVGILWLPILFTPIQVAGMLPFLWQDLANSRGWESLGGLGVFDLVLGYGYVLVWLVGYWLVRRVQNFRKVETV